MATTAAGRPRLAWWAPVVLVVLGVAAYANTFGVPFLFDDLNSIVPNPNIKSLWPIWRAAWAPSQTTLSGRPLVSLSLAMDYAIGGLNVGVYHFTNLVIHLAAALTLLGIVRRTLLLPKWGGRFGASATGLALITAAVWLVHPLQTESVTYIVQRAESLMGLFYLLTLYCFIRAIESRRPARWQVATIIACAAGMGSKEVMASAPILVLLYDRTFVAGSFASALKRRWRVYVPLAATWTILAALVATGGRSESVGVHHGFTPMLYARTQLGAVAHYLRLIVWPRPLSLDYEDWPLAHRWSDVMPAGAVVIALLLATIVLIRAMPWIGFLGAWFFLILAPSSSFVPIVTEVAAEHRVYLPLAAVAALVVVGGWLLLERLLSPSPGTPGEGRGEGDLEDRKSCDTQNHPHPNPLPEYRERGSGVRAAGITVGGALVLALLVATVVRNSEYQSALSIWSDTVAKRPNDARALFHLGEAYMHLQSPDIAKAVSAYRKALDREPDFADDAAALGQALMDRRDWDAAADFYRQQLARHNEWDEGHVMLGTVELRQNNRQAAEAQFMAALAANPNNAEAEYSLGVMRLPSDPTGAEARFANALRDQPDFAEAQDAWGAALLLQNRPADAVAHFRRAVELQPDNVEMRGHLLQASGAAGNEKH